MGDKSGRNEETKLTKALLLQKKHPWEEIVGGKKNVFFF